MTREEAISIMNVIVYMLEPQYDTDRIEDAVEMAIKALEQEPKWIPVSERLPEKDMHCLVSVGKLYLTQIAIYSDLMGTIDHKIFYQGDYGYGNFENITEYVKAWMPLPSPYKAESEDS